jgi:rSAM/selenodomain-associated transferase 1
VTHNRDEANNLAKNSDTCLTIFAKAPELGKAKTRLAQSLGPQQALVIYQELLEITAAVAQQWPGPVLVCETGETTIFDTCPLAPLPRQPQVEGNLGTRLAAGLTAGLQQAPQAIAIGTDCPALSVAALTSVIGQLHTHPIGIGPSSDGGYWSVALASPEAVACCCAPTLPWSQPSLLTTTQEKTAALQLSIGLGTPLDDVDTEDDWLAAVAAGTMQR